VRHPSALAGADDPFVDLDPKHYKLLAQFDRHFPDGPPSLVGAHRVVVRGDVTFGAGVTVLGDALVEAAEPTRIADGATLGG